MMTLYSIRILWITCFAVFSYALPTTHDNAALHSENIPYPEDSADYEKVIKEMFKTVATEMSFHDEGVKGRRHPLWRDSFDEDHTFYYTFLSDEEEVENTSPPFVKENVKDILPASDTSKDEDVENTPTSENVDVESPPPPSVNSNGADIPLDFDDVENTSPSEDGDVGNTPSPDNEDGEQTSLSDNEDVENTSSPSNEDVGATDLCANATIDTITRTKCGSTYVFKGDFYWEILPNGIPDNYPRKISDDWDGLEGNLDASVYWPNGKTFFFKGKKYWRFTNKEMDPHYPNLISVGFEGIPDDLGAALVWSGNGKTYFFKGDQYWRFDLDMDPPARSGYPASITAWSNELAGGIDAAIQWENGRTYFFKGDKYYRYNDKDSKIDKGYPLSTSEEWFNCRSVVLNAATKSRAFFQTSNQKQNTTTQAKDMGELVNEYREFRDTYRH